MEKNIRYANTGDAHSLNILMTQLMGKSGNITAIEHQIEKISENKYYHLLIYANKEDNAIATAMGIICLDIYGECRPFMVIENFVVDEYFRGKGIGTALIKSLEDIAVKYRCGYIMLVSSSFRKSAHEFYKKSGFAQECGFRKML